MANIVWLVYKYSGKILSEPLEKVCEGIGFTNPKQPMPFLKNRFSLLSNCKNPFSQIRLRLIESEPTTTDLPVKRLQSHCEDRFHHKAIVILLL